MEGLGVRDVVSCRSATEAQAQMELTAKTVACSTVAVASELATLGRSVDLHTVEQDASGAAPDVGRSTGAELAADAAAPPAPWTRACRPVPAGNKLCLCQRMPKKLRHAMCTYAFPLCQRMPRNGGRPFEEGPPS